MRRRSPITRAALPALLALALSATAALAQQTMNFRPLPPESVASLEARSRLGHAPIVQVHTSGRNGHTGVDVVIDSSGGMVNLPHVKVNASVAPDAPETPETPATPETPSTSSSRETTGEIVRFGSDIDVPANQVVEGDVVSMGGSVTVEGKVKGSVTSMGGDVTLGAASRVDGDVVCLGGTLHEEPGSSVGGQHVTAPRVPGSHLLLPILSVVSTGMKVMRHLLAMLILLGIAFLFVKLAPGRTQAALDTVNENAGGSFIIGLLLWGMLIPSLLVLCLAVAVLCITIIGIPLAMAALAGYGVLVALAAIWGLVVGYTLIGSFLQLRLRGQRVDIVRGAMTGVFVIYGLRIVGDLLHVVPVFGILGGFLGVITIITTVVLATLGAGALARTEYRRRTVQDWWQRTRPARFAPKTRDDDFPPPPVTSTPDPAPAPPPSPAPPSPPEAFAPPPQDMPPTA
jgi:hypothetical protein